MLFVLLLLEERFGRRDVFVTSLEVLVVEGAEGVVFAWGFFQVAREVVVLVPLRVLLPGAEIGRAVEDRRAGVELLGVDLADEGG